MKNSKSQTLAMIGVSLLVVAGIIIAVSLSLPKAYENTQTTASQDKVSADDNVSAAAVSSYDDVVIETTADSTVNVSYPLNLNTATVEELMTIDGIGEKRAGLIVAYRQQIGSYTDVSQIKDIKGIGDSIYAQIAPYLTV